ncbi:MAG: MFS transporter [Capsulimonadales bacterium]|nr:MFS transporter [Capsulimonadales bacterium]
MSSASLSDVPEAAGVSRTDLRVRLSAMMFLEYAVWGAWMPILSATLTNRGIPGTQIGTIYGIMWLACIAAPFFGGQIADRFMPGQWFLAASHLLAAGAAWILSLQTGAESIMLWIGIWSLLFMPTLAVTNAIAFHHIERTGGTEGEREREFAWIRTAGTIGWIAVSFLLPVFMNLTNADKTGKTGAIPEMQLAALAGVVMAIYSLLLPNTPPTARVSGETTDPLAFRKAFGLFRTVPGFTAFMIVSFIAATEFQFYYLLSGPFLESGVFTNIPHEWVSPVKSISQWAEIVAMAILLPYFLPRKGMKWCLLLGSFAWPLRYLIFAIGQPAWLVVASLGLHGFGYAFVIVGQQLYVDRVAPKDIRSSAQALLNLITLGLGNWLGSEFCGRVMEYFTKNGQTNWVPVFILPTALTLICALAYLFTFRDPSTESSASGEAIPSR